MRPAGPDDAARLARLRYRFRAAEDPAVEPEHRGRGLGSALMERAVVGCREEGVDSLILWPTDRSRSLYRRFGCAPSEGLFELDMEEDRQEED